MIKKLISLILLFALATSVFATDEKSKLAQIAQKIEDLKHSLFSTNQKKQTVADDVENADKKINQVSLKIRAIDKQIRDQSRKLTPLLTQQKQIETKLEKQRTLLVEQLQALYRMGQHGYLELLLNQQDPTLLSRMATYYQTINHAREELIKQYLQTLDELKQNQASIKSTIDELTALKSNRLAEQSDLKQQQQQRKDLLKKINQEIKTNKQRITQLETNKQQLQNVINQLEARRAYAGLSGKDFAKLKHKLPWPVKGNVTRRYGDLDGRMASNGIMISAPSDTPVHAIASGEIIFANWMRGYGNIIIISHKGGYMSLYAHNNALLKQVGDKVEPGDEIALVGNSGGFIETGLYFEIRYQGKPRNPVEWFRK